MVPPPGNLDCALNDHRRRYLPAPVSRLLLDSKDAGHHMTRGDLAHGHVVDGHVTGLMTTTSLDDNYWSAIFTSCFISLGPPDIPSTHANQIDT